MLCSVGWPRGGDGPLASCTELQEDTCMDDLKPLRSHRPKSRSLSQDLTMGSLSRREQWSLCCHRKEEHKEPYLLIVGVTASPVPQVMSVQVRWEQMERQRGGRGKRKRGRRGRREREDDKKEEEEGGRRGRGSGEARGAGAGGAEGVASKRTE